MKCRRKLTIIWILNLLEARAHHINRFNKIKGVNIDELYLDWPS